MKTKRIRYLDVQLSVPNASGVVIGGLEKGDLRRVALKNDEGRVLIGPEDPGPELELMCVEIHGPAQIDDRKPWRHVFKSRA